MPCRPDRARSSARRRRACLLLAFLILCFAAALSLRADDGPKVISNEEWLARVAAVDKAGYEADKRAAALREVAAKTLVEIHGKIQQIVMDVDGADPQEVAACGLYGGGDVRRFPVTISDVETVRTWHPWDRLTWRVRPRISSTGEITFELASQLGNCVVTRNPGFVPPPTTKRTGDDAAFATWNAEFAKTAYAKDDLNARALWKRGVDTKWILPATVTSAAADKVTVRLSVDGYIEATKDVRVGTGSNGAAIMQTKVLGHWGFEKKADLPVIVEDPQAAALMTVATRVDVAIDLAEDGLADAVAQKPFKAEIRPWKIKGKR